MPANAMTYFSMIASIASFDFFSTEETINKALRIESLDPFDMRFTDYGFSSGYFLNNLGTQLFVFLALMIAYVIVRCARKLRWRKARHILENFQVWLRNTLIVATVESYVLILICCLISFNSMHFDSFGAIV
jgi:ABC-type maltose transport system permease subunit